MQAGISPNLGRAGAGSMYCCWSGRVVYRIILIKYFLAILLQFSQTFQFLPTSLAEITRYELDNCQGFINIPALNRPGCELRRLVFLRIDSHRIQVSVNAVTVGLHHHFNFRWQIVKLLYPLLLSIIHGTSLLIEQNE